MRERDRNRKLFHKGHYEVIAARFREELSKYIDTNGEAFDQFAAAVSQAALLALMKNMADRFEFDNDLFDREIFMSRCFEVSNA